MDDLSCADGAPEALKEYSPEAAAPDYNGAALRSFFNVSA
jgi:hypothetical protein